jgi:hypothetical protein
MHYFASRGLSRDQFQACVCSLFARYAEEVLEFFADFPFRMKPRVQEDYGDLFPPTR